MARGSLHPGVIWQLAATGPGGPTGPLGGALSLGTLTAAAVIGATILTVVLVLLGMRAARPLERGITLAAGNGRGRRPASRRQVELAVLRMLDTGPTPATRIRRAS